MIASLYQSGSSSADEGAVAKASAGTTRWGDSTATCTSTSNCELRTSKFENVSLANARIEADVVPAAMPDVHGVVDQVAHLERVGVDRRLDRAVLHVMRIEIDDRQQGAARIVRIGLAVREQRGVIGRVKAERRIELQGALLVADLIHARNQLLNVIAARPAALAELILFRVRVLLGPGDSTVLAQLEAAVDAVG